MTIGNPSIESGKDGAVLRLQPQVDLVASTVEAQRDAMTRALDAEKSAVVLDLGTVEQLDSLGITLILGLFKSCQKAGVPFSIEGVRPDLMRVFRLFNLPKFFPVREA
jgi:anti-sigma B factor antagonist